MSRKINLSRLLARKPQEVPEVLPLCRHYVRHIEPGMYWFMDDTFSHKLQEGKELRAIVICAKGRDVFAFLLKEKSLTYSKYGDYRIYAPQVLIDNGRICCVEESPSLELLQKAAYNIDLINRRLQEAGKPQIKGIYWSWRDRYPYFKYDVENAQKGLVCSGDSAKLRRVLDVFVRR